MLDIIIIVYVIICSIYYSLTYTVCVCCWGGTQCESNSLFDHGQHKEGISKSRFIQTTFFTTWSWS